MTIILNMQQLNYRKGVKYYLSDINWQVHKGEKWLVLGSNGSGKTTLASIAAGYRTHTDGLLELFDTPLTKETCQTLRKRIGFVSSSYFDKIFSNEMGLDIVLAGVNGSLGRQEPLNDENVKAAKQLLDAFEVGRRGLYPYYMLSRGQQQKVLLARGFINAADLYIFDEPCEGLDLLSRAYFYNTVAEMLLDETQTMVYITHHYEEIIYPGFTHALLLRDGMIHSQGTIETVFASDNFSDFLRVKTQVKQIGNGFQLIIDETNALNQNFWKRGGDNA